MQRMTRQRLAVRDAIRNREDFTSAQQLYAAMKSDGSTIGLATVYRTLQSFADEGEVDVLRTEDGENLYRRCVRQEEHHHHLVCRTCGRTIEIDGPTVETWASQVGAQHGFVDIEHTIELFGTCEGCQKG